MLRPGVGYLLPALVAACNFTSGQRPLDASGGDADTASPPDAASLGPWAAPTAFPAPINSGLGDDDPSMTDDLLELYWGSQRAGGPGREDIWYATRNAPTEAFGTPMLVANVNSAAAETTMRISGDGLALVFMSDRASGSQDLYIATRPDRMSQFSTPVLLSGLDTAAPEYCPFTRDRKHIVFCRTINTATGDNEMFYADRTDTNAQWTSPTPIPELDFLGSDDCDPVNVGDTTLYFSSTITGTSNTYVARRASPSEPFGPAQLVEEIDAPGKADRDAWVSADERTLVFASDRGGTVYNLYFTSR